MDQKFYLAAFNHLIPFPGTPFYQRMERENRLSYEKWWLDDTYRFNLIPFQPKNMSPEQLQSGCLNLRRNILISAMCFIEVLTRSQFSAPALASFLWHQQHFPQGSRTAQFFSAGRRGLSGELIKVRQRVEVQNCC